MLQTGARLLAPWPASILLLLALIGPARAQQDDSCNYYNDGECDEPQYCAAGTDCSDCGSCGSGGGDASSCTDQPGWHDPVQGSATCSEWEGFDCHVGFQGYSLPAVVLEACPVTCGTCSLGPAQCAAAAAAAGTAADIAQFLGHCPPA